MKVLSRLNQPAKVESSVSYQGAMDHISIDDAKNLGEMSLGIATVVDFNVEKEAVCGYAGHIHCDKVFVRKLPDEIMDKATVFEDGGKMLPHSHRLDRRKQILKELEKDFQKLVDQFDKGFGDMMKKHGFKLENGQLDTYNEHIV